MCFYFSIEKYLYICRKLIDMKKITVEQKHQMRQAFHRGGKIRKQNEPNHKLKMVNIVTSHGYTNNWVITKNNEND